MRSRRGRAARSRAQRAVDARRLAAQQARMRWCTALAAAGLAFAPAQANVPPPIPSYAYYGPVRHCDTQYALEARAGEGLIVTGATDALLRFGRHHVGVSRMTTGYVVVDDPAVIRRTGTLTLDGGVTLARYRVSSGGNDARVTYLYDPGGVDGTNQVEIGSDRFDGTDRDRATLARVALGEAARALCADVPEPLRPTPARAQPDAWFMRPGPVAGPLTVCWAEVALDVERGEAVVLPWTTDSNRFALIAPGFEVGIAGDFRSGSSPTGALPAGVVGPLLSFTTHFTLGAGTRYSGVSNQFMRAAVPATNRARLLANRDIRAIGPDPGPGLTFGFSRPLADAERDALIGRVRARTATDTCFDPDRP